MNKQTYNKIYHQPLSFILLLSIFIVGFYILSSIYTFSDLQPKSVVLDEKLFEIDSSTVSNKNFYVDRVNRLEIPYSIWDISLLDNNSLLVCTPIMQGSKLSTTLIGILTLNDNMFFEIGRGNIHNVIVSPNKEKLFFSDAGPIRSVNSNYLYNFKTQTTEKHSTNILFNPFLLDDARLIGTSSDELFIQNMNTGNRKKLAPIEGIKKIHDFKLSPDGKKINFIGAVNNGNTITSALYSLDPDKANSLEEVVQGNITGFLPLKDGTFLLNGNMKDKDGIYLYNTRDKSCESLVTGNIYTFDLSPDNTRIAYTLQSEKGLCELHTARFINQKMVSDRVIYYFTGYIRFLKWSDNHNMLFYINEGNGKNTILKFVFRDKDFQGK